MNVYDLNRSQLVSLKQNYLCELANEGAFSEVTGREYDEPSYSDMANADELVPDDVIFDNYENSYFSEEDFS